MITDHYGENHRAFLRSYFTSKFKVFFEVVSPRWRFLAYEFKYTLSNVIRTFRAKSSWTPAWTGGDIIETRFGKFLVRAGTQDPAMISPAFERKDFDLVLKTIRDRVEKNQPVLFADIGANIGKFCISVGNEFKDKPVFCIAFDPVPAHIEMLYKSRDLNGISKDKMNMQQVALHQRPGKMPMTLDHRSFGNSKLGHQLGYQRSQIEVDVVRMDHFDWRRLFPGLSNTKPVLFIKMDVEGAEADVLKGADGFFEHFGEVIVMTEDTSNQEELYATLRRLKFRFSDKITPYNSWWIRQTRP